MVKPLPANFLRIAVRVAEPAILCSRSPELFRKEQRALERDWHAMCFNRELLWARDGLAVVRTRVSRELDELV